MKRWLQVRALVEEDVSLADGVDLNYEGRRLADALYESRRGGELRKDLVTRALAAAILDGSKHDVKVVDGNEVRGRAPTWPGPAGEMGAD